MKKSSLYAFFALVATALLLWTAWNSMRPTPDHAEKTITVIVDAGEGRSSTFTIVTEEPFLRGALEQIDLIAGDESMYGLFVTTVDGIAAQADLDQWWMFTKDGGQELPTGVSDTPIEDGASYEITLKTGW